VLSNGEGAALILHGTSASIGPGWHFGAILTSVPWSTLEWSPGNGHVDQPSFIGALAECVPDAQQPGHIDD
jgi:hypothetical protein